MKDARLKRAYDLHHDGEEGIYPSSMRHMTRVPVDDCSHRSISVKQARDGGIIAECLCGQSTWIAKSLLRPDFIYRCMYESFGLRLARHLTRRVIQEVRHAEPL